MEAKDLAELAELVSERVARDLGAQSPVRRAEGTTTSILAYRFYEQGLRAFDEGDSMAAQRFFIAALAEDSTFAMAAYYAARVSNGAPSGVSGCSNRCTSANVSRPARRTALS